MPILGTVIGVIAMVVLLPVPVAGPIGAGFIAGLIAGDLRRGTIAGFLSGVVSLWLARFVLLGLIGLIGVDPRIPVHGGVSYWLNVIGGGIVMQGLVLGLFGALGGAISGALRRRRHRAPGSGTE